MLKRIVGFATALFSMLLISLNSFAIADKTVVDKGKLFTGIQIEALAERIDELRLEYGVDIVIYTLSDTDGEKTSDAARRIFEETACGISEDKDGILLLIVDDDGKGTKDFCFVTNGWPEKSVFDEYGVSRITSLIKSDMKKGRYESACSEWLGHVESFLSAAKKGSAYSENRTYRTAVDIWLIIGFWTVCGAALGIAVCILLHRRMKTKTAELPPEGYVREGSFTITKQRDIFIYSGTTTEPASEHKDTVRREIDVFGGRSGKY